MATLLRIDSSPLSAEASFSRGLTEEFVERWRAANPDGSVVTRDLAVTDLEPVSAEWIAAAFTPEDARTERQREVLALSDELTRELFGADEYVIGVAMHNFSIPGTLKLWVDQVARAGKTFSYASGAPEGLLKGKKATLIVSSGGVYDPGTPMAAYDFADPYLRAVLGFLGVTDVRTVRVGGTAAARDQARREAMLQKARVALAA